MSQKSQFRLKMSKIEQFKKRIGNLIQQEQKKNT